MSAYKQFNKPRSSPYCHNQGYYKLINPEKYIGDASQIIYRSLMELKFCNLCDVSEKILKWASEAISVTYVHPLKKKKCQYFPDFVIEVRQKDGSVKLIMIEVKPMDLTPFSNIPRLSHTASQSQIRSHNRRLANIAVNTAKYQAAVQYCLQRRMTYQFLTETFFDSL